MFRCCQSAPLRITPVALLSDHNPRDAGLALSDGYGHRRACILGPMLSPRQREVPSIWDLRDGNLLTTSSALARAGTAS